MKSVIFPRLVADALIGDDERGARPEPVGDEGLRRGRQLEALEHAGGGLARTPRLCVRLRARPDLRAVHASAYSVPGSDGDNETESQRMAVLSSVASMATYTCVPSGRSGSLKVTGASWMGAQAWRM